MMTNYKWWFTKNGEEKKSVKQRLQEKRKHWECITGLKECTLLGIIFFYSEFKLKKANKQMTDMTDILHHNRKKE